MLKKDENNIAKFIEENEYNITNNISDINNDINFFEDNISRLKETDSDSINTIKDNEKQFDNTTKSYDSKNENHTDTSNQTSTNQDTQKVYSYSEIKDNINDPRLKRRPKRTTPKKDNTHTNIYAGFWIRAFAFLFDIMLVNCIMYFLEDKIQINYYDIYYILIFGIYSVLFTSFFGCTFGKALFGIKVMSEKQDKINFFTIIIREFFGKIFMMYCKLFFIFTVFSNKKHSFIDYFSDTCVIKSKYELEFKNSINIKVN